MVIGVEQHKLLLLLSISIPFKMAPPKNPKHVVGQSTLSKFFAGASNVPLESKKEKKEKEAPPQSGSTSTSKRSPSPTKKSKSKSTGIETPKVEISNTPVSQHQRLRFDPLLSFSSLFSLHRG